MNNYDYIFKRKSTRKYEGKPFSPDEFQEIKDTLEKTCKLFPSIEFEAKFLTSGDVLFSFAPNYIAFYSEDEKFSNENCGYILAQMDLFFSSKGYGSCFYGYGKKDLFKNKENGKRLVMMLAFGKTKENVHRSNVAEFKRKESGKLVLGGDPLFASEVTLAPTAMNLQGFFIERNENRIRIYKNLNTFQKIFMEEMSGVDIGIVTYFLALTLMEKGHSFQVLEEDEKEVLRPKLSYEFSLLIS